MKLRIARKVVRLSSAQRKRAEKNLAEYNAMVFGLLERVTFADSPKVYGIDHATGKLTSR